jgi:hypothetical protein
MNPPRLLILGVSLVSAATLYAEKLEVDFEKNADMNLLLPGKVVGAGALTIEGSAAVLPAGAAGNFLYSLKQPFAQKGGAMEVVLDFWTKPAEAETPGLALVSGISGVPAPQSALGYKGADTDGSIGVPRSAVGVGDSFEEAQPSLVIALRFSPDGQWTMMAFNDASRQGTAISEPFALEADRRYRWETAFVPLQNRPGYEFTSQIFEVTEAGNRGDSVGPPYAQQVTNEALLAAEEIFAVFGSQQGSDRGIGRIDTLSLRKAD